MTTTNLPAPQRPKLKILPQPNHTQTHILDLSHIIQYGSHRLPGEGGGVYVETRTHNCFALAVPGEISNVFGGKTSELL